MDQFRVLEGYEADIDGNEELEEGSCDEKVFRDGRDGRDAHHEFSGRFMLDPCFSTSRNRLVKRRRNHEHYQHRHKRQRKEPSCASPIHPDINLNLTRTSTRSHSLTNKSSNQQQVLLCDLSQLLTRYFEQIHANNTSDVADASSLNRNNDNGSKDGTKDMGTVPIHYFSQQPMDISQALRFSDSAIVLVEANEPHRVVHTNAAYGRLLVGSQMPLSKSKPPDVATAICTFFKHHPVNMYPVFGSDGHGIRYYLIEYSPPKTVSSDGGETGTDFRRLGVYHGHHHQTVG